MPEATTTGEDAAGGTGRADGGPAVAAGRVGGEADLAFAGAAAQAGLVAAGEVSSAELVELSLARIEASGPTLNAFRCVRADEARAEAAEADRRVAGGERLPLLGVPVAIKDDVDLAGEETRFGCRGTFRPREADCEAVRRLRAAGAVVVGKTHTPEIGQWPVTEGPGFGATRNPWSPDHTPGGSSGGAAAAVAAGLVAAAMGSDGAGSVRIPAAWTGLVGIKPQRGRISTWPERDPFNGITVLGPLTRSVADAALLLDVLGGGHPGERHAPPPPAEPYASAARREPRRLRIGLSWRIPFSGAPARLDPRVRAAVARLAEVLADLGHEVVRADPAYGLVGASFMPRSTGGVGEWLAREVGDRSLMDRRTLGNVRVGRALSPLLGVARALEAPLRHRIGGVFKKVDVVLAPTTAQPPLRIGAIDGLAPWATDKVVVAACPYAWPWNVIGWPGVNVPAGLTPEGLPVGAQLLGPANSESLLISLAAQLEKIERWQERRPPGWS
ncbi:MAG TPA: amidase [Solirubrobacteraceae bacterium]|nr:amidase [Solirubrobacteraceae bacterium]